jgi:hypothetical protein
VYYSLRCKIEVGQVTVPQERKHLFKEAKQ